MASSSGPIRLAGILSLILGVVFILAGGTTWALVQSELSDR